MEILLLDNYDSFTYNLYHYLLDFTDQVEVRRNDEISAKETDRFTHIVLSPGPGLPKSAGVLMDVVQRQAERTSILGVCLGMQAIAEHFGGSIYNQREVKHGVTTHIEMAQNAKLFTGLPNQVQVGLYHSWAVQEETLPSVLNITARSTQNVLMAIEHRSLPICGVQFHPESILTQHGKAMIENWLKLF